jgi:hypothetical protein
MKTLANLFILVLLLLTATFTIFATHEGNDGPGCTDGLRDDGNYYMDCYHAKGGDNDDNERIDRALTDITNDNAGAAKLIFNEGNYTSYFHTFTLSSHLTLEGRAASGVTGPTSIHLISTSATPLFYIPAGTVDLAIRDMGMHDDEGPGYNNIAIMAEGYNSGVAASQHIEFNNLHIAAFGTGLYVLSTVNSGGWQFDDAEMSNTLIEGCAYAIHLLSDNANMGLDNVVINSGEGQNGIYMERSGYVSLNYVVGNGHRDGSTPNAGTFIQMDRHSAIDMNSVFGEAWTKELVINGFSGYKFAPVTITNSAFPGCLDDGSYDDANPTVSMHDVSVISNGNYWGCTGIARPIVTGTTDIYSTGDRFCLDSPDGGSPGSNPSSCFEGAARSEFVLNSDTAVLKADNNLDYDDLNAPFVNILGGVNFASRPLLALTLNDHTNSHKFSYAFKIDTTNKRLTVENISPAPTPAPGNTGYYFKGGPVQLETATSSTLSSYSATSDGGSLLFCSNCAAGSSPCAGSGSGALAVKIGSNWVCK